MDRSQPRGSTRRNFSYAVTGALLSIVLLGLFGCRDESVLPIDLNQAPETVLTNAPGDSQTTFYAARLFWAGFDNDGEVVGYEWAITDSLPDLATIEYSFTTRTDSTFRFSVLEDREVLGHRFYVRAIDDNGRRDETPAYTFFGARNTCAPEVKFTEARGISPDGLSSSPITSTNQSVPTDTIPAGWSVCFRWTGEDCDVRINEDGSIDTVGTVERFFYHLSPRELNDRGGSITDTSACYDASLLQSSSYQLFVRAVDDAGFAGLDPEVRTFVWNKDPVTRIVEALADTTDDGIENYVPFADGDTLPIPVIGTALAGISVRATIEAFDPDNPNGTQDVSRVQARVIEDIGNWETLGPELSIQANGLYTDRNGWKLIARSQDVLGRNDGTPDTITFYVNRSVQFKTSWLQAGDVVTQIPSEGDVLTITPGQVSIPVLFLAVDPDPLSLGEVAVEYRYKFDSYPLPGGGTKQETFFPLTWQRGLGNGRWQGPVRLQTGEPFVAGDYVLSVQAQEFLASDATVVGKRIKTRTVRFRVVEE